MELKPKMNFEEMAAHMEKHTYRLANRVSVGMYAKKLGYRVEKQMRDGKILFFYINEKIQKKTTI